MIGRRLVDGLVVCVFAFAASGCFLTPYKHMEVPTKHVVMFNGKGKPVRPTGNLGHNRYSDFLADRQMTTEEDCEGKPKDTCTDEYSAYLKELYGEIEKFKPKQNTDTKKILLYIHGGLNSSIDSLSTVTDPIEDQKDRVEHIIAQDYYPIFINWDSSLWSSYFDYLLFVRQGQRRPWWGPLTFPFVLVSDVGRSILRAPLVWGNLIANDLQTVPLFAERRWYSDAVAKELLCRYYGYSNNLQKCTAQDVVFQEAPVCFPVQITHPPSRQRPTGKTQQDTFPIDVGDDKRGCLEMDWRFLTWVVTEVSTKLVLAPPLDAFGSKAWDNMLRRVQ